MKPFLILTPKSTEYNTERATYTWIYKFAFLVTSLSCHVFMIVKIVFLSQFLICRYQANWCSVNKKQNNLLIPSLACCWVVPVGEAENHVPPPPLLRKLLQHRTALAERRNFRREQGLGEGARDVPHCAAAAQ